MTEKKLADVKNWSVELEQEITSGWKESDQYSFDVNSGKPIYSIDTPPPYVNRPIHIGQAVTYCYMDFFARYKRMKGFDVVFPLGLDRNGLPIEMAAEKEFKVSPFKVGREKFVELCMQMLEKTSSDSIDSFSRMGVSFTSFKEGEHVGAVYKTDSQEYRALTQSTFIELYKKGMVYEDTRINNWDPKLRTTIADSEIEYKELDSHFNDVTWSVSGSEEKLTIATTRPELIGTCSAVIYHPEDSRYVHLKGKNAVIPIYEREVPIMPHPLANPEKGTGIVMMCAGGDLTDIQFVREQKLKPIIWVGQDGKMTDGAGPLSGLKVREAREKIIEILKEKGLLVKQEKITHRTPVSERSGAEIEFIEMPEFYLKQLEFKEDVRKLSEGIAFYPEDTRKILNNWIDAISIDWPISRRRYYATPIPLWYSEDGKKVVVPLPGKYYQSWKEEPPKDAEVYEDGKKVGVVSDYSDEKWMGETRVFDTWMDSSISELYILKYLSDDKFFERAYPATLRPQGKEIVRTWLYYTLLRGYLETGKACFEDVWIHQHILDGKGRKMSKSLGNVIDPQDVLREDGAEAMRLWAAIEGDLSKQDLSCSKERIHAERKTINKILNVAKFVSMFDKPGEKPAELMPLDALLIDLVEDMTERFDSEYEKYNFYQPALELRRFLWDVLASNYIEMVKNRAYNEEKLFSDDERQSALYTLHFVFERFLTLLYPILPQLTSFILKDKGIDILNSSFPKVDRGSHDLELVEKIMQFNSLVWKAKKDKGISLREGIGGIEVPKDLEMFSKDLKACHKI